MRHTSALPKGALVRNGVGGNRNWGTLQRHCLDENAKIIFIEADICSAFLVARVRKPRRPRPFLQILPYTSEWDDLSLPVGVVVMACCSRL